jgi:hypothetical protein
MASPSRPVPFPVALQKKEQSKKERGRNPSEKEWLCTAEWLFVIAMDEGKKGERRKK